MLADADNTLRDLHNFADQSKAESNNCCIIYFEIINTLKICLPRSKLSFFLQLRPQGFSVAVPFSGDILYYWRHFTGDRKRFPNLISASCFWRNALCCHSSDYKQHLFSYSRMGQISSTLLMDIHLGMLTSQTWWQMVHGVITWFSMVLQTALKLAFTWPVCRITMTL